MQYFGFDRPSFAFKTFGFGESSPKLQADFTTGTYKSNGAANTFADLFTFNRAGKAWLVKDTGLQEYAADVPRLDNGLLIEQKSTNLLNSTTNLSMASIVAANGLVIEGDGETFAGIISHRITTNSGNLNKSSLHTLALDKASVSFYAKGVAGKEIRSQVFSDLPVVTTNFTLSGGWDRLKVENISNIHVSGFVDHRGISAETFAATLDFWGPQIEPQLHASSLIATTTTPVTRPADYLMNKITGTTVTGDWDSTLTLSIVNGNLVHSGYGRIRSLEIN